jgi:uncharacterized protein (DUF1501 family)
MNLSRRYFLKSSGVAMASFAAAPSFLTRTAFAQGTRPAGRDRPILVAIFQRGAADGLSMIPPFGDRAYASIRPQIAIAAPRSGTADTALDLDGFFGLHPALGSLKPIYDEKHLAIVHAVGSPSHTRSHFDAQDYMEAGTPDSKTAPDGWLNRCIQTKTAGASPFQAIAFSPNMPRSLMGPAPALAMQRIEQFDVRPQGGNGQNNRNVAAGASSLSAEFAALWKNETFDAVAMLKRANPRQFPVENRAQYPGAAFGQTLQQIAQLIKANIGLEVAFADISGWDTHANQGAATGQMANRLREFGDAIAAFHRDLGDRMRNVVLLTMTEFGRAVRQNGSGGTDHGHASALFAVGGPVRGGKVYGQWPGLAAGQLFEGRDLALTTDFRDVFAEVARKHVGIENASAVFPGYRQERTLGIL